MFFSSQLDSDCGDTFRNINSVPPQQRATKAGIEFISPIPKSANFAVKMIRLLIIRASCLVVDTFDWGSNYVEVVYQWLSGDVLSLCDKEELVRYVLSRKCPPHPPFSSSSSSVAFSHLIHSERESPKQFKTESHTAQPSCHSSPSRVPPHSPQMSNQANFSLC